MKFCIQVRSVFLNFVSYFDFNKRIFVTFAIAIDLDIGSWWAHVCCVAPELCKCPLIAPRDILELYVLHFKYRIDIL